MMGRHNAKSSGGATATTTTTTTTTATTAAPARTTAAAVAVAAAAATHSPSEFLEDDSRSVRVENEDDGWTDNATACVLLLFGLLTRLYLIDLPNEVVFDEVHFGGFTQSYLKHEYFFDIHPPLGKLIFLLIAKCMGLHPETEFKDIGRKYPDNTYVFLRIAPAITSACTIPLLFLLCRRIGLSWTAALLTGSLALLDTLMLTQCRLILMDSFLWFFQVATLYCGYRFWTVQYKEGSEYTRQWWLWTILTGISMGCVVSVKWTGLGVMGVVGLRQIWFVASPLLQSLAKGTRIPVETVKARFYSGLVMLSISIVIYVALWFYHFQTLYKTGPGDAFMTLAFRSNLEGSDVRLPDGEVVPSFYRAFIDLHDHMYAANAGLTKSHPYGSMWYTWPLSLSGVLFWQNYSGGKREIVYLIGNPLITWFTTCVIVLVSCYFISLLYKDSKLNWRDRFCGEEGFWLFLGYLVNLLPYIAISRDCFVYHYVPSLLFAYVLCALALDRVCMSYNRIKMVVVIVLIAVFVGGWIKFMPLAYGIEMEFKQYLSLRWFQSWKL